MHLQRRGHIDASRSTCLLQAHRRATKQFDFLQISLKSRDIPAADNYITLFARPSAAPGASGSVPPLCLRHCPESNDNEWQGIMLLGYSWLELAWLGLTVFLLGMGKGGFPVGPVALPLLVLLWPGRAGGPRTAVAFMLPLLCTMDVVAVWLYRRHIAWRLLLPLIPGALLGVLLAGLLMASPEESGLAISDQGLRLLIGLVGISFVLYRCGRRWLLRRLSQGQSATGRGLLFGVGSGIASTMAHAAGPLAQMYFLPQGLRKMQLAGTIAAFFFGLNLVKLAPFIINRQLTVPLLLLDLAFLPVVPLGVLTGYGLVRLLKEHWYAPFLYVILTATSLTLIAQALRG